MQKRTMKRRDFLKAGLAAGAAAVVGPATLLPRTAHAADPDPNVYSAFHENMVTGTSESDVQYDWVKAGVDACVKAMTGQSNVGSAWEAVLGGGVTTSKKVAIKVNCLNTHVHPQFATVKAIVEGLKSMCGGSFPANRIYLFDNNLWVSGKVNSCYGSANLDALGIVHSEDTYTSGQTVSVGGTTLYVSKFWNDADYAISLAKMSPHQYYAGGLSGVIKNMMGAVSKNNSSTYGGYGSGGSSNFHSGSPYTAWKDFFSNYAAAHIDLYIVDMLFACRHENESGWSAIVKRITMGKDPCSVDCYNVDKINTLGMAVKIPVTKNVPNALQSAGVGTCSYNLINVPVSLNPTPSTRSDIDREIRDHKAGSATDSDVRQQVQSYREQ